MTFQFEWINYDVSTPQFEVFSNSDLDALITAINEHIKEFVIFYRNIERKRYVQEFAVQFFPPSGASGIWKAIVLHPIRDIDLYP